MNSQFFLVEYCILFLAVNVFIAKPAEFKFPREKVLAKVGRTAGGVASLERQLVNSRDERLK